MITDVEEYKIYVHRSVMFRFWKGDTTLMLKQELAAAGVRQLRDIARSVGITMPQKLRKEELIDEIVAQMQKLGRTDLPQIIPMKKRGQKSKQEREALAAQQAAMQQKNQDEPPQTGIVRYPSASAGSYGGHSLFCTERRAGRSYLYEGSAVEPRGAQSRVGPTHWWQPGDRRADGECWGAAG